MNINTQKSNKFRSTIDLIGKTTRRIDRRILFFLVFVTLSALLWLMNALSKDYITEIDCPIEFYNIPSNYVLVGEIPHNIKLQVSGRGFTLIKYPIGSIALPFKLDLQSYFSVNQKEQQNVHFKYYVSSKKKQIEQFLNDEIKVLNVSPETMQLNFDKLHQKIVKVQPITDFNWSPQYRKKDELIITPDSITVKGPQSILDTLEFIYSEIIKDKNIQSDRNYTAKLIAPNQCKLTTKKVHISLNSEQFTENTVSVPIKIINKPDTLNLTIFPNQIKITYLVSFENFKIIKPTDFQAAIDFTEIQFQNTPQKLNVNLLYIPEGAKILKYWPQKARFIINQN